MSQEAALLASASARLEHWRQIRRGERGETTEKCNASSIDVSRSALFLWEAAASAWPDPRHCRGLAITGVPPGHPSWWQCTRWGMLRWAWLKPRTPPNPLWKRLGPKLHPSPRHFIHVLSGSLASTPGSQSITGILLHALVHVGLFLYWRLSAPSLCVCVWIIVHQKINSHLTKSSNRL